MWIHVECEFKIGIAPPNNMETNKEQKKGAPT